MTVTAPAAPVAETEPAGHYARRIVAAAAAEPARPAVFWRDGCLRGGELAALVLGATAVLRRHGVAAGGTVAILMSGNRPDLLVARYAAHLLGAAVVHVRSMNPRTDADAFDEDTQAGLIELTGAAVLVVDDEHVVRGRALADRCAGLTAVVPAPDLAAPGAAGADRQAMPAPDPAARAAVTFTSGSTGGPKAIGQSFGAWNRLVTLLAGTPAPVPPTRILAVTPMSHTVAPMLDAALAAGGSVVLHEGFDAAAVLRCVEWLRVTDVYLAVPHLHRLLDHDALDPTDTSSLRRVVYSGTPTAPHRVAQAVAAFGSALVQVYGTSETGGITCLTAEDHREPELHGTVGRPFPWVDVELRDPETGDPVAPSGVGEVHVRTPTAMDGYLDAGPPPEWHATGDLGHWDRHGYLVLVGRRHHVVKSGGLKLHPLALQRSLLTHPGVAEAVAFGRRDADRGEHLHAAVVRRPGGAVDAAELAEHAVRALGPGYRPAGVEFLDRIPLTPQGKPDLHRLVERTSS